MKLRHFPAYEVWRQGGGADIAELNKARVLPDADLEARVLDLWVTYARASNGLDEMLRIYQRLMQRLA